MCKGHNNRLAYFVQMLSQLAASNGTTCLERSTIFMC